MQPRKLIELTLTTGMMAMIMSLTMMSVNFGINEQMFKIWIRVYPLAWAVAIPAILVTRKCVQIIMKRF